VKSVLPQGFGFITCAQLRNEGSKNDVYIHKINMDDLDLQPGTRVDFQAYVHKGQLQARNLRPARDAQDGDDDEGEVLGEYEGVIKCFYEQKKFGFIVCDELKKRQQNHGKTDVFVHQNMAGDVPIEVGLEVRFEAFIKKGQVQARNLQTK
jgi:cold shock CspA family protein